MLFPDTLIVVRGGGDIATGVVARLARAGFPVAVTELQNPLTVRRTVALSSAITDGRATIEGTEGIRASVVEMNTIAASGQIPVAVCSGLPDLDPAATVVVDARLAKRNIDTTTDDAQFVIALGPGFHAGVDCNAVIETARGHRLGRVIWDGPAEPNTGTPGVVGGRGRERVLRAPVDGVTSWTVDIGTEVSADQIIGETGGVDIRAPFDGMIRGLIAESSLVPKGMKIGDVDPRLDRDACHQISDKALAVGGGVVEAVMMWLNQSN